MSFSPQQHQLWVTNFFSGKIREFFYHLRWVVRCCDESMVDFRAQRPTAGPSHEEVLYAYSALTNTVMTLKDGGSTFLEPKIDWSDIDQLRHGLFMHECRNAATHDGHPVISGWADGKFFVPSNIKRYDNKSRFVQIAVPSADVRTFCLEFAKDFAELLERRLRPLQGTVGATNALADLDEILQSNLIPQEVRNSLQENKNALAAQLAQAKTYPIDAAIALLIEIQHYCDAQLAVTPS
ncbi:hypothetical protein [Paraburkholderia phenoliruptrix]|uniref:hypothetical protein n=1 Tax=Paraburkholderia phenoliruptrix TaxID=252970 RepID=UPI001C6F4BB7|nr:hypothetical protein [Paraburkholderia phenoliruptrix]MBW9107079.1 hypothetical protein [Paraburkholderia phenoliruptrix]MBW9132089.1 hypothetical protein [Paraburkholderia ginsengiterrae]